MNSNNTTPNSSETAQPLYCCYSKCAHPLIQSDTLAFYQPSNAEKGKIFHSRVHNDFCELLGIFEAKVAAGGLHTNGSDKYITRSKAEQLLTQGKIEQPNLERRINPPVPPLAA